MLSGNWGPARSQQCVSAHAGQGAWQPLAGRESALTSLLHPYFRPWQNADAAEATGPLPRRPDKGFKFSFLLQANFP
jgi:hypothetical protein